jgi:hypothetical protein
MIEQKPLPVRRKENKKKPSKLKLWLAVFLGALVVSGVTAGIVVMAQKRPAPVKNVINGKPVIRVPAGGDLQAAINMAQAGDTIELQAGASYTGAFVLPYKQGNDFITIQSSGVSRLPEGRRVEETDAPNMARILSSGRAAPTVITALRAHHYRFVGIEFAPSNSDIIYNLIDFGSEAEKVADVPHHLEIDRSYLHPFKGGGGKVRRGMVMNSADTVVKNSYFQGFAFPSEETQAICGWSGSKNIKIINNKLEGGAENVMFGGADPKSADLIPSDIEITGNWIYKPREWSGVTSKTLFELKNAKRVTVTGNLMENSPEGETMRITVRNQDNSAPFSTIEDVVIKNNVFMNTVNGTQLLGKDDTNPSQRMKRVKIVNNLFLNNESYFIRLAEADDVEIAHNTIFHGQNAIVAYGGPSARLIFRDNIFGYNEYGFFGDEAGVGYKGLAKYVPGSNFRGNAIVNTNGSESSLLSLPPGSFEVRGFGGVGFMNYAGKNFRLAANSRLKGKASDGTDIGANIDEIFAAIPQDLYTRIK